MGLSHISSVVVDFSSVIVDISCNPKRPPPLHLPSPPTPFPSNPPKSDMEKLLAQVASDLNCDAENAATELEDLLSQVTAQARGQVEDLCARSRLLAKVAEEAVQNGCTVANDSNYSTVCFTAGAGKNQKTGKRHKNGCVWRRRGTRVTRSS